MNAKDTSEQKLTVTKRQAENIWLAINILMSLNITARMRYAATRCRSLMQPVMEAISASIGDEPDLSAYKKAIASLQEDDAKGRESIDEEFQASINAHNQWVKTRAEALGDPVEIRYCPIPLECDFQDTIRFPGGGPDQWAQNQAIVDVLVDILRA